MYILHVYVHIIYIYIYVVVKKMLIIGLKSNGSLNIFGNY